MDITHSRRVNGFDTLRQWLLMLKYRCIGWLPVSHFEVSHDV